MIESILTVFFVASRASLALTSFGLIVGSAIYDWRAINWQRRRKRNPKAKALRSRPLVSVIIIGDNSIPTQCIESTVKTTYRNLEILVLYKKDKRYKQSKLHPRRIIKHLALPTAHREKKSWVARLRRAVKGELVLVIDSNTRLYTKTIHEIVCYFALNQQVEVAKIGTEVEHRQSLLSLVKEYEQVLLTSLHKTLGVFGGNNTNDLPVAWRRRAFLASIKPPTKAKAQQPRLVGYISNPRILANSHAPVFDKQTSVSEPLVETNERSLNKRTKWRNRLQNWYEVLLLLEPVVLGYSIYVFIAYKVSTLLLVSWLITLASFSFFVWGDEKLKAIRRLRLTAQLPVLISLVYLMVLPRTWNLVVKAVMKITKLSVPKSVQLSWLKH